MATIHLVRHGQASFGGEAYDRLSAIGHEQARRLGALFAGRPMALAVRGTMLRHRQTAEAIGGDAAWEADPGWDEFDYLDVIGALRPDLRTEAALRAWAAAEPNPARAFQRLYEAAVGRWSAAGHDAEYRESHAAFRARVDSALERVRERLHPAGRALVVTSGGPISALVHALLGTGGAQPNGVDRLLVNGGVTTLTLGARGLRLATLNCHAHLDDRDDLVTTR